MITKNVAYIFKLSFIHNVQTNSYSVTFRLCFNILILFSGTKNKYSVEEFYCNSKKYNNNTQEVFITNPWESHLMKKLDINDSSTGIED